MPEVEIKIETPFILYTEAECIEYLKSKRKTVMTDSIIFYLKSFERVREVVKESMDDNKL